MIFLTLFPYTFLYFILFSPILLLISPYLLLFSLKNIGFSLDNSYIFLHLYLDFWIVYLFI
jgi:hypothetical protein